MSDLKTKKADFSKTLLTGLYYSLMIAIGVFIVVILVNFLQGHISTDMQASELALLIAGLAIAFYAAFSIQMPLHELGHLAFGKLTGYELLVFRIGRFMWIQKDGAVQFRRVKFAGSGGQCLMVPPASSDGKIPYLLYNLGGIIVNFAIAVIAAGLALLTLNIEFLSLFFILTAAFGMAFVVMNGIPVIAGKRHNDGYNIYTIRQVEGGMRAYETQLRISEQTAKGKRLKEMPAAWFELPSQEAMSNGLLAGLGVFAYKRMLDLLEIEEADRIMASLQEMDSLTAAQGGFIIADRVYCELLGENRKGILDYWLEKRQSNFMDANKTEPAIIRTIFTYELLQNENNDLADKFKKVFDQVTETYPFPQELAMERQLMAYAEEKAGEKKEKE
ncbi:MAG: M50 family metallopeptidase [Clostridiaceae bacterium]|nr:M50 family metallopeptidase [Clostridiaceae bacterium]